MNNEDELGNRARQFAGYLLADNKTYHNHKETMAHACVVLEIVIFGWIMSKDGWAIATSFGQFVFWFVFLLIWLMLHLYIRWELRYRRWAARQDFGIRRMLGKWTSTNPIMDELRPYENRPKNPHWTQSLIDLFFPCFCGSYPHDRAAKCYPIALVNSLKEADGEKDCSLYWGEWLPTGLSIILFAIVSIRKLIDC